MYLYNVLIFKAHIPHISIYNHYIYILYNYVSNVVWLIFIWKPGRPSHLTARNFKANLSKILCVKDTERLVDRYLRYANYHWRKRRSACKSGRLYMHQLVRKIVRTFNVNQDAIGAWDFWVKYQNHKGIL